MNDAPCSHRLIAIDVGVVGAAALFADGQLVDIADLPTLNDGPAGRRAVNAVLLAGIVRRWAPTQAVVEYVGARPGEAAGGAFSFGRCRGLIEGVLGAMEVPTRFMTPAAWKRRVGISPGRDQKDAVRSAALNRWPHHAHLFARKRDDGRAEAALLGVAFLENCQ